MLIMSFTLLLVVLIILSIRERMRLAVLRSKAWDVSELSTPSPLSQALTGLVGTAGGIYLSLVLLFTFLGYELPERVYLGKIQVEPLAALSIALAVVQPFFLRIFQLRRRF
ncbi:MULTISPECIES: hypothetical protein [Desulfofundulus]|jgi:hypothetical protein|uniref:Uncharacterized protein n=2 Tax=Desulfofundulus TaxID=2282741 RepID=A0A1M4UNK1_9FIRM|nr:MULTISPECIES: hypothetical protein [Desulfofundulus]MBE3585634.1 hypothetical protein [Thermoanaerobacter sp.]MCS5696094.1 hypothetical protein [Desulfofundulus thermocisternus]MDK2887184.1 hypothetical protein [Thermoanaerobacter sp.]SHE58163.1 hypothetical protein SAMN02745218_00519 [Desulfofundulus australicus DSM 11792]